jgi:hypothetical protein
LRGDGGRDRRCIALSHVTAQAFQARGRRLRAGIGSTPAWRSITFVRNAASTPTIAAAGAPGGDKDEACAIAGLGKIKDRLN